MAEKVPCFGHGLAVDRIDRGRKRFFHLHVDLAVAQGRQFEVLLTDARILFQTLRCLAVLVKSIQTQAIGHVSQIGVPVVEQTVVAYQVQRTAVLVADLGLEQHARQRGAGLSQSGRVRILEAIVGAARLGYRVADLGGGDVVQVLRVHVAGLRVAGSRQVLVPGSERVVAVALGVVGQDLPQ